MKKKTTKAKEKPKVKAKAKPKQKKVSKTQKKLENKIKYRQSKINKLQKDFVKVKDLDKRKKIDFEGKSLKPKQIESRILSKALKVNKELYELKNKLKRYKKPKQLKINDNDFSGLIQAKPWQLNDILNATLNNPEITHINGFNIKKDKDKVLDLINKLRLKMDSNVQLLLVYCNNMRARLTIHNGENVTDDDI